jgi:hypothetical protein
MMQLSVAACPHCGGINELPALTCHACEGELVPARVERTYGGSDEADADNTAHGALGTRFQTATRSMANGGLLGSSRETYPSTEDALANVGLAANAVAIHQRTADLHPQPAKTDVARYAAVPGGKGTVQSRRAPTLRRAPSLLARRPIGMAAGAGLLLVAGIAVYEPLRGLVRLSSPPIAGSSVKGATSTESAVLAQRTSAIQTGFFPAFPSSQRGPWPPTAPPTQRLAPVEGESTFAVPLTEVRVRAASRDEPVVVSKSGQPEVQRATLLSRVAGGADAKPSGNAGTCTAGMAALGLCPSESTKAQPPMQVGSSAEVARVPAKDRDTGRCKEAVVALGLCAQ